MWTEGKIARILARNTFKADLCVLPNCTWTGHEVDLLVVANGRRIVDVEIKISRADLKADKHKEKWWRWLSWDAQQSLRVTLGRAPERRECRERREWPQKVWKHYYAMPAEIWRDALLADVQPMSGVLLLHGLPQSHGYQPDYRVECVKRARPCRDAHVLTDAEVIAVARLASLRMWDAYAAVERMAAAERSISHGLMTPADARREAPEFNPTKEIAC